MLAEPFSLDEILAARGKGLIKHAAR